MDVPTHNCSGAPSFWLDSAQMGVPGWPRSLTGKNPDLSLRAWGSRVEVASAAGDSYRIEADPFDTVRTLVDERRGRPGAAVGYFGYGLRHHIERLPARLPDDLGLPDLYLGFYDEVGEFDAPPIAVPTRLTPPANATAESSNFSRDEYERVIRKALDYIRAGDIYQVNLAQRFAVPCGGDPFDVHLRLRSVSPAPFGAFLRFPGFALLSSSPERFISYRPGDRVVETRPIKGTRPRGPDPRRDAELAHELVTSEKDRAENLMIVDLERNDLGRVAEVGSVVVPGLFELESFSTVHHLTSTVRARLRAGQDAVDLLRAMFPCGSVTGAPKIRAMEIIEELEKVARGPYTGAIGYLGFDGSLELSVAIRTIIIKGGTGYFHVGGGIVADSVPALEYEETLHKGAALANALGASLWSR